MQKIKLLVQRLLRRLGLHHRLKVSALYDFYWLVLDRRIIDRRRSEVEFYRELLIGYEPGDLIFDIGANHGSKTDIFLRLGAKVVAVEPDELNQAILKNKFLEYRFSKKPVTVVGKAVSDSQIGATIWIDAPGCAMNSLSEKWVEALRHDNTRFGQTLSFSESRRVETITLEGLISAYGRPFFIKIDVEGHELDVLRGLRQRVPFVSFELNLPDFKDEGLECLKLLEAIGVGGKFNFTADCRRGLEMQQWLTKTEFENVLRKRDEKCIEVFWAAPPFPSDLIKVSPAI